MFAEGKKIGSMRSMDIKTLDLQANVPSLLTDTLTLVVVDIPAAGVSVNGKIPLKIV